jgi:hypothetical protein
MWLLPDLRHVLETIVPFAANQPSVVGLALGPTLGRTPYVGCDATLYVAVARGRVPAPQWFRSLAAELGTVSAVVVHSFKRMTCLLRTPSLHIVLKAVTSRELGRLQRRLTVVWDRKAGVVREVARAAGRRPRAAAQAPRRETGLFWMLAHSAIRKCHRGERFEALRLLDGLRSTRVLPLIAGLEGRGAASGNPWFEGRYPHWIDALRGTVAAYRPDSCREAIGATIDLYEQLLRRAGGSAANDDALAEALRAELARQDESATTESGGLPRHIGAFLDGALPALRGNDDVLGVGVTGSWLGPPRSPETGALDAHSDLDLIVLVRDARRSDLDWQLGMMRELSRCRALHRRRDGSLVALYGPPLLHVDLLFKGAAALRARFRDPIVLWERDARLSAALAGSEADPVTYSLWPQPTQAWIESRFWGTLLDCATRLRRGELFRVISVLSVVRARLLGPLAALSRSRPCRGVRRLEQRFPDLVPSFAATVAGYDEPSCWEALDAAIALYGRLQPAKALASPVARSQEEEAVAAWLPLCRHAAGPPVTSQP